MELAVIEAPEPGPGQVRVRNRAAALNFFDVLQIRGQYQVKPPFPFTPGAEISGIVDAVGADVHSVQPGDAVLGISEGGGYAEQTVLPANRVFKIPSGMTFAQAAAFPIVYQTSWLALVDRTTVKPGEWLLVHAGASGVGMSAIQIGKALGAHVIATAGSADKLDFAKRQGADHALDYNDESWVEAVRQLTGGRGADIIYDPVGGDIFDLSTRCVAIDGRLITIGFAAGRIPSIALNRVLLKNISVVGVFWGGYIQRRPAYVAEAYSSLTDLWNQGRLSVEVSRQWRFDELPAAMRALENRQVMGKAVIAL